MKNKILLISIISLLSNGLNAQISKFYSLEEKVNLLPKVEGEAIYNRLVSPKSELLLGEPNNELMGEDVGKPANIGVNWENLKLLTKSKNYPLFKNAEILSVSIEKGQPWGLKPEHLTEFKNLKYIYITTLDANVSVDEVKKILQPLTVSKAVSPKIEVIVFYYKD